MMAVDYFSKHPLTRPLSLEPGQEVSWLAEALTVAHQHGERYYEAELYRLRGEFLLVQKEPEATEAEACFWQAIDVARRQQAKSWELRAVMSLSRLWQQQGKPQAAWQLLAEVYGWFTEGFATADIQEAKTLLEELTRY